MRLKDRMAIIIGAGQGPGEGLGNGRATALRFAQEGVKLLCVDRVGIRMMPAEVLERLGIPDRSRR